MLLRGMIPLGYMPNPDRLTTGGGLFILCGSVHDALTETPASPAPEMAMPPSAMPMPMTGEHHHDMGHHPADAPCVFAAVVALAAMLAIVILVVQPYRHRGAWTLAVAQFHPVPKPPGAQPARGPPLPVS